MLGLNELMIKFPDGADYSSGDGGGGGEGEYYYSGATPDYNSGDTYLDPQLMPEVGTGGGAEDEEPATPPPGFPPAVMPAGEIVDNYDTIPDILKKKMGSGDSRYAGYLNKIMFDLSI